MEYSYSVYSNNEQILPLHRRLYGSCLQEFGEGIDPFDVSNSVYKSLRKKGLISHELLKQTKENIKKDYSKEEKKLKCFLRFFLKLFGAKRYTNLIKACNKVGVMSYHSFLME